MFSSSSSDTLGFTRRGAQTALALLLLFVACWDVRAVLADRRIGPTDTTVQDSLFVQDLVGRFGPAGLKQFLEACFKGPLVGPVLALFQPLVGDPLQAARLASVLLHLVVLWMIWRMAILLTRRYTAGLLAVLAAGTFPSEYGWFRLDSHEPFLAVATLLTLWLLMRPMVRVGAAAQLGLVIALGTLAKVAFPIHVALPCAYYAARRLRERSQRRLLAVAGTVAFALVAWWMAVAWDSIAQYIGWSVVTSQETWGFSSIWQALGTRLRLLVNICSMRGAPVYLVVALGGAAVAWRWRTVEREPLLLLLLAFLGTAAILVLVFDSWPRYMVPVFPVVGLLCAIGVTALLDRLALRWSRARLRLALAGGVAALLALYVHDNVVGVGGPAGRENREGLVAPDRRPHVAYPRALLHLARHRLPALEIPGSPAMVGHRPMALGPLWAHRGYRLGALAGMQALQILDRRQPIHLLFAHRTGKLAAQLRDTAGEDHFDREQLAALLQYPMRVVRTFRDPDDVSYSIVRVSPKAPDQAPKSR